MRMSNNEYSPYVCKEDGLEEYQTLSSEIIGSQKMSYIVSDLHRFYWCTIWLSCERPYHNAS
jgi:hypothetical protein